jgi:hypothetical protein
MAFVEQSPLSRPGDHPVEAPVVCTLTRFGLRAPHHLLPTYLDFQRVVREARRTSTPGLLRAAFLIENPVTCYSLSLWENRQAIPSFGTNVPIHVTAARRVLGRLAVDSDQRPELWSTKWRLVSVSNNLSWDGFDLRPLLEAEAV